MVAPGDRLCYGRGFRGSKRSLTHITDLNRDEQMDDPVEESAGAEPQIPLRGLRYGDETYAILGACHKAQAGTVEETRQEEIGSVQMREDGLDLLTGENDWETLRSFCAFDIVNVGELNVENFLVEEEQRIEGYILGGSRDVAFDGKVREVGADFRNAQVGRMARMVKADVVADDAEIGLFGMVTVVFEA